MNLALFLVLTVPQIACVTTTVGDPQRGYEYLTTKAYLPPDFDQETFDELWKVWPEELREQAAAASPEERRKMAFTRYGLSPRPGDPSERPLQYVIDDEGNWTMNCFACHGGEVLGRTVPGAPNSRYALETLTADVRATKLRAGKPLARMDVGSLVMPLGRTNGTTNAVMFGVALLAYRDAELNFDRSRPVPRMVHHDMDAPPWWHFKKRSHLYADGFVPKGARALMQFMLVPENGPEDFHQWEQDYRHVFAYLSSVEPPEYPFAVDQELAARGRQVFEQTCSDCHGTYGDEWTYPERIVPIEQVGTDPVRLDALSVEHRRTYRKSWFAKDTGTDGNEDAKVILDPGGYVAPPLDGIWASAPYLHNGSVPTLWHVLHPDERPAVWKRRDGYDRDRVGLAVHELTAIPETADTAEKLREYFDTQAFGKSASGHTFPDALNEDEKQAVLEYLKSL